MKVLQTFALPLGYSAFDIFSLQKEKRTFSLLQKYQKSREKNGADYEARTRYLHLGKVALYRMS